MHVVAAQPMLKVYLDAADFCEIFVTDSSLTVIKDNGCWGLKVEEAIHSVIMRSSVKETAMCEKEQGRARYYSLVYPGICFGPRSKSISWSKTPSRDFSWDMSPFLFVAQTHRKKCSATKDFVVLQKQQRERGWDGMER